MTPLQKLRRAQILCHSVARNIAYFRAGKRIATKDVDTNFMATIRSNAVDIAISDWCKLFADTKDLHCWENVADNKADFERRLLAHLGVDKDSYTAYKKQMRWHRDKFVAHLDSELTMYIPRLDHAKSSTLFYSKYLSQEASGVPPGSLHADLPGYYRQCTEDATFAFNELVGAT